MKALLRNIAFVFFLFGTAHVVAQDSTTSKHFGAYLMMGPNFYHNNWQYFKNDVHPVNFTIAGRFMWEPGYRLSVGINTGYYKLYTADVQGSGASAHFRMYAIPIQLIMKMNLYKGIYAMYGMGPSICYNNIFAAKGNKTGELSSSFVSPADITIAVGYAKRKVGTRFLLGGEVNFFHSSKSKENIISTMFSVGYRIKD